MTPREVTNGRSDFRHSRGRNSYDALHVAPNLLMEFFMTPLQSIVNTGTKLWLDSVDPVEIAKNREFGATGATSNPIIIADLLKTGRFDGDITAFAKHGLDDEAIAWAMTDKLVKQAQDVFEPIWQKTHGDDGWVSFELDPLLEDTVRNLPTLERTMKYIDLAWKWSNGHCNRMIKVPATPGGLGCLEELVAHGVACNVTLIFSESQYRAARDACYRGALRARNRAAVKTVYSIFVSRVDVYTEQHVPTLGAGAQGHVGIVNAKKIWQMNKDFWADKGFPLKQELIFASTGTKKKEDAPWKYVGAFAGSDIQTNPPATNDAVQKSGQSFTKQVDQLPSVDVLNEIMLKVNINHLEETLMREGLAKFADPHKALIKLIAEKAAGARGKA
jgi:transaldolase